MGKDRRGSAAGLLPLPARASVGTSAPAGWAPPPPAAPGCGAAPPASDGAVLQTILAGLRCNKRSHSRLQQRARQPRRLEAQLRWTGLWASPSSAPLPQRAAKILVAGHRVCTGRCRFNNVRHAPKTICQFICASLHRLLCCTWPSTNQFCAPPQRDRCPPTIAAKRLDPIAGCRDPGDARSQR